MTWIDIIWLISCCHDIGMLSAWLALSEKQAPPNYKLPSSSLYIFNALNISVVKDGWGDPTEIKSSTDLRHLDCQHKKTSYLISIMTLWYSSLALTSLSGSPYRLYWQTITCEPLAVRSQFLEHWSWRISCGIIHISAVWMIMIIKIMVIIMIKIMIIIKIIITIIMMMMMIIIVGRIITERN